MSILHKFLKGAYQAVQSRKHNITICVGNEAADADSIISSLCLAYLKQAQQETNSARMSGANLTVTDTETRIYVPVVCVPRNILRLRRETHLLLSMVGLRLSDLVCLEDVDIHDISSSSKLHSLMLTDHNVLGRCITTVLPGGEDEARQKVELILDHHKDLGAYPDILLENRQIAFDTSTNKATAGSACTLVAELLLSEPYTDVLPTEIIKDLSVLLFGVICIDTQNMDAKGVGTARDAAVLERLRAATIDTIPDRDVCFAALRDAKSDPAFWNELTTAECLSIDYKQFPQASGVEVGIASTLLPIMSFLGKEQAVMNMARFMSNPSIQEEKEVTGAGAAHGQSLGALHMLLVMSTVYQPAFRRELLVASFDSAEVDALASFFERKDADVQLSPMTAVGGTSAGDHSVTFEDGRILCIRVFNQGNVKVSRKQIAPLVQDFYDSK